MNELKIHPAATLFRMLSDEDLASLAADIKEKGLLHPIIVDAEEQVIDGRNRLAACRLAGVEPRFEQLNGRDAVGLIISANLARRDMAKGEKAMVLAMLVPEPGQRGRGKKSEAIKSAESAGFSSRRLNEARSVLHHSRELAERVRTGVIPLDKALEQVDAEKQQALGEGARMDRLLKGAPDLAELVAEERMSLNEATAAWSKRESERRAAYQSGLSSADRLTSELVAHVAAILGGDDARAESDPPIVVKPEAVKQAKGAIALLEKFSERMLSE